MNGDLRGCIGRVSGDLPVGELVRALALAAAREDPRFPPVTAAEVEALHIEISVLRPPRPVPAPPADIHIGRDGLLVERGRARGLLLPQVAAEHGWGARTFLDAACEKAGLPPGAWREPGTRVLAFEADVFQELEPR